MRKEQQDAIEKLQGLLSPGDTVYTILRHVSTSGMTRHISTLLVKNNEVEDITYYVAKALGYRRHPKDGGLVVSGCGMDMGFSIVYNLSATLFKDGFNCTGKTSFTSRCPSNDHSNGDTNYSKDNHHKSGGYAIRHAWL